MATSGVVFEEGDTSGVVLEEGDHDQVAVKVMELNGELQTLVNVIAVDDWNGVNLETLDKADKTICALKYIKMMGSLSLKVLGSVPVTVPEVFVCPLSKEIMRDPVVVASGQTYDRPFIQKWLNAGNNTCPQTQQELSNVLTPNVLLRRMISQWCKHSGIQLPDPIQCSEDPKVLLWRILSQWWKDRGIQLPDPIQSSEDDVVIEADRNHLITLLSRMSWSLSDQKESARKLRMLTKEMPSSRALFAEIADAIPRLIFPLSQNNPHGGNHPDLQEDIVATLFNLSVHDDNKKLVAETSMVIPLLMDALRSGTIETKSNAAATLSTLSALDSNKSLIGRSGALNPLIDLLDEGQLLMLKDVASAIFNLCIVNDNKEMAALDGAVQVILKKIRNRVLVDELVAILALLSNNEIGVEDMVVSEAGPLLLSILREAYCARTKENCIAILYTICFSDSDHRLCTKENCIAILYTICFSDSDHRLRSLWKEMREEEKTHGTISQLAQNGTSRAKRKASGILGTLNRG